MVKHIFCNWILHLSENEKNKKRKQIITRQTVTNVMVIITSSDESWLSSENDETTGTLTCLRWEEKRNITRKTAEVTEIPASQQTTCTLCVILLYKSYQFLKWNVAQVSYFTRHHPKILGDLDVEITRSLKVQCKEAVLTPDIGLGFISTCMCPHPVPLRNTRCQNEQH